MLTVLGGLAEFERELIRARTGEGRKRAKDRGVKFGRPRKLTPFQRQATRAARPGGPRRSTCGNDSGPSALPSPPALIMRPLDIRKRFADEGLRGLPRCEVRFEVAASQKRHDEWFVLRVHSEIVECASLAPLGSEPLQHSAPDPRIIPNKPNGTSRSWPKCGARPEGIQPARQREKSPGGGALGQRIGNCVCSGCRHGR
jgi:resolvase-like protein